MFDTTKIGSGKEEIIKIDENTIIGIDYGKGKDKAVYTKARKEKDGSLTILESGVLE